MSFLNKTMKNDTGSPIEVLGVTIDVADFHLIETFEERVWEESSDVDTLITDGDIIVNDGSSDLNVSEGFIHLRSTIGTSDSTDFKVITNKVERMRFLANGDIKIGIASPSIITQAGKIGLNTLTPNASLDILGMVNNKPVLQVQSHPTQFVNPVEFRNQSGALAFFLDPGGNLVGQDPNFFNSVRFGHFTSSAVSSTSFGWLASCFGGPNGTAVGGSSRAEASKAVAVGWDCRITGINSTGIGPDIRGAHTECFLGGGGATSTAANQGVFGSVGCPIQDWYFGEGVLSASPQNLAFNSTSIDPGTDVGADFNFDINVSRGRGTGIGGHIRLRTALAGVTGSSLNALTTMLEVHENKFSIFGVAPALRPDITGSRGGNAALADLLTKGATLGLWTDSTSA